MSTNLSTQKTMLAKLLAGENLNVLHKRGLKTAMIDLKARALYLPVWEDMTGELYDLLGGHEVGHALFTPQAGWHSETHDENGKFLGSFKNVLNVCEDVRIEKLIKRKYPGLARSFVAGYKILYGRDFFGIKKLKDFSKLNIIDRINIYAKCGSFLIVPFNDEERELVREAESTETWEQVVEFSRKLYERAKQERDQKMNSLDDLTEELMKQFEEGVEDLDLSDDLDNEGQEQNDFEDFGDEDFEEASEKDETCEEGSEKGSGEESDEEASEKEEADEDGEADDGSESDEDSEKVDSDTNAAAGAGKDADADEPQSITDRIFRDRESNLIVDGLEIYTYNLPKPMLDRIIVPHKVFADNFFEHLGNAQKRYGRNDPIAATCASKFNKRNSQYINLLVKEFEMRKNARQYARTEVAKSGELDMSKLHKYRFSNDLFSRIKIVPKGKSHGMIMFVDMSGSMNRCFASTMEQTLALVAFCRKVNIPFDVYGFSDRGEYLRHLANTKQLPHQFTDDQKFLRMNEDRYELLEKEFHLIHMISSRLAGNAYRRAFELMAIVAMNWNNVLYARTPLEWNLMGFALGGTPFIQTLMASRPMIEQFKRETDTDIVNVIYLTDGEGMPAFRFTEAKISSVNPNTGKPRVHNRVYLIDQKTKKRVQLSVGWGYFDDGSQQRAMTEFVRELTGCKHIGFFIAGNEEVRGKIRSIKAGMSEDEHRAVEKFWRENEYYSSPHIGYDMYYYVKARTGNADEGDYNLNEDMTTKKIAKVFSEAQFDKRRHRVMVSKFAQEIAA